MEPKRDSGLRGGTDPFALQRVGSRNKARGREERQGGPAQGGGRERVAARLQGEGELQIGAEEWLAPLE